MLIRPMTIDDYEEVYSLWMSCKGMGLNNLDDSKEGIEKFYIETGILVSEVPFKNVASSITFPLSS